MSLEDDANYSFPSTDETVLFCPRPATKLCLDSFMLPRVELRLSLFPIVVERAHVRSPAKRRCKY